MDLIDRDALYVAFMDSGLDGVQTDNLMEINQIVDEAPSVDVAPIVHGKWIDTYGDSWDCSVCGTESYVDEDWRKTDDRSYQMNYCHYCGAKMCA